MEDDLKTFNIQYRVYIKDTVAIQAETLEDAYDYLNEYLTDYLQDKIDNCEYSETFVEK